METIEYKGYDIDIYPDCDSMDPRKDWDPIGKMFCFHRSYDIGDEHSYNKDNYNSWDEFLQELKEDYNIAVVYPVIMYEHSGITISHGRSYPYNCRWDSGQIGFHFITKDDLRKEWNVERVTKKLIEKAVDNLKSELEVYDNYLAGSVYSYIVEEADGSCGGFFGYEHEKSGLLENAREDINAHIRSEIEKLKSQNTEHFQKVKEWIKNKIPAIYRKENQTNINELLKLNYYENQNNRCYRKGMV